ncbi:MAG TPA: N-acetyltransferase [Actinobacteria bacterium]|nr:N-acetyltransferase [Actinomycetota bacterium]
MPGATHEQIVTLRDGTRALIRPIRAEDKEALAQGLARLSSESRYRRFLRPVTSLNERELKYLTEIDYTNHYAWVAVAVDDPGQPGLGVARYIRDPLDPEVAEAAVAVVDDYQGMGIGTMLLRVLVAAAQENGIHTFRAWVLGDNTSILRPLERIGARRKPDHGVLRIEVDLAEVFDGSSIQDALRAVAAGEFQPEPRE